ncbi:MAG: methyltransferase [Fluviicola sp.]|jgi:hypothetical protein|uniref:TfoX/Sxy family protein n=1 Tax=Fluviicola sp. TaxID=1917219 RepID=UPI002621DC40|nr:TfoX/Sxy family protein [Fluviicola sp.]MDF3027421.1 methyltransferase [Fluviicola sp.]
MAYNEVTAQRIRACLLQRSVDFEEKKMFMGICFMVDEKMLCCTHSDKITNEDLLLCRVSDEDFSELIEQNYVEPMIMGERKMKNYLLVSEPGFEKQENLQVWIDRCLKYNPTAKKSKKSK